MGARQAGIQPGELTDEVLRRLHDAARDSGTRESYRSASALITGLQTDPERAEVWTWIRHPISQILAGKNRTYDLPDHFLAEIEEMTEVAARLRSVTVKETWEYVADKTRDNYRNTLRALVMALHGMSVEEVERFEIPTGVPIAYAFSRRGVPIGWHYLDDDRDVDAA